MATQGIPTETPSAIRRQADEPSDPDATPALSAAAELATAQSPETASQPTLQFSVTDAEATIASQWLRSLVILHRGHWEAARRYDRWRIVLGIVTAVTAGISGASVVTELATRSGSPAVQIAIGILSVMTAALAAVQSFVKTSEFGARHKAAGVKFGQLRRELQQYSELGVPSGKSLRQTLEEFDGRWKAVEEEALPLPKWAYEKGKRELS